MLRKLLFISLVIAIFTMLECGGAKKEEKTEQPDEKEVMVVELSKHNCDIFTYVCLPMTGSFSQYNQANQTLYNELEKQQIPYLKEKGKLGIYYNDPEQIEEDSLVWEVGVVVEDTITAVEPLVVKKWEYENTIKTSFQGDSTDMAPFYQKVMAQAVKEGYEFAGPPMEIYTAPPKKDSNGTMIFTFDLYVPVSVTAPSAEDESQDAAPEEETIEDTDPVEE